MTKEEEKRLSGEDNETSTGIMDTDLFKGIRSLFEGQQFVSGGAKSPLDGGPLPQGYGSDESILRNEMDTHSQNMAQQVRTMQTVLDEDIAERQRRAEELEKGLLTEEQIAQARRSSTMVSGITSALANIANGIAVSRGAMNATVPDGYTLAYQHWNDVEQRNRARRQEYDKIIDSIYQGKMKKAELEYGLESEQYKQAAAQWNAIRTEKMKQQEKREQREQQMEMAKFNAEAAMDRAKWKAEHTKSGSSKKESTPKTLDDYRTITSGSSTYTIPSGVSIESAYLALAKRAKQWVEDNDGLNTTLKNKFNISFTGGVEKRAAVIDQLMKDLRSTGLTDDDIREALEGAQPQQTTNNSGDPEKVKFN